MNYDEGDIVLDTPDAIEAFFMLARRGALKLEIMGLRHSKGSVYAFIKKEYGFKGNRQSVLEQYEAHLRELGILR